ncbi:hypothetical protein A2U01_0084324, partial [Trifolium medium]|nr:hypothetical protein [Trifolium medium]
MRHMKMDDDVIGILLLCDETYSFTAAASVLHIYPYDPGPIGSSHLIN